jgi:peptidyl-prolyl cis-trans isomerase A (cyclophilin A)
MNRQLRGGYRAPGRCLAPLLGGLVLMSSLGAAAQESATLEPRVRIQTTAGDFVVELDTVRAPLTSENFLRYVRDGFYDGTLVHRVVPNFVVQGGGFGADYREMTVRGPIPNESGNGLPNRRGSLGMARGESPHSATSQFYVNLNDNPGLNPLPSRWGYAVFGQVVEGLDVVDRIAHVVTGQRGPFGADAPLKPILITRAEVIGETRPEPLPAPAEPPLPPAADAADSGDGAVPTEGEGNPAGDDKAAADGSESRP